MGMSGGVSKCRFGRRCERLGRRSIGLLGTERRFKKSARLATRVAGEALGFEMRFAIRRDDEFDRLHRASPATPITSLIEPSGSGCSTTEWPPFLASSVAFSTAYA